MKSCELGIKYVNQAILFNPKYGKGAANKPFKFDQDR